jgi:hopene-associated glycosyltransferase HpnB
MVLRRRRPVGGAQVSVAAALSLIVWLALLFFRGGFWRADQRLDTDMPEPDAWPAVVAVIPARNEAATIGRTVASLLGQDYPGAFSVIVVDDNSDDGTAAAAGVSDRLSVVSGKPLPAGWTGKLWAVHQGLDHVTDAAFVLLTDADIEHSPHSLRRLVAKAEEGGLDLVSLMVLLRCQRAWERLLIPAFVFFFQKLFPFSRVNDPTRPEAAAAGGCMLVRRAAFERAGGVEAIRDRLIDDCALAAAIKPGGPIWLGLTGDVHSLRSYERLGEIWTMVARTAYEQLRRSPLALIGTVMGMAIIYLVPPLAVASGEGIAAACGLAAWLLMIAAYRPTLRLYGLPAWYGLMLPVAALLYTLMTVDSARRHRRGRGGAWKGRTYT